ncbi:unnamed protein product [Schistosoma margrebowiei]|uniref:Uncharacterized protein n=1 Tax=Schistosoma margrebowiei TaxID=48269 RepID=A0A183LEU2_9TREM|nr:unnamed protein product [Schistosoma margrebowiei]
MLYNLQSIYGTLIRQWGSPRSRQGTLDPGFVLLGTRQHSAPVILKELVLPGAFDPVSPSFTSAVIKTLLFLPSFGMVIYMGSREVISNGCLQPNGMSICCAGREKKCFVYKSTGQSSISRYYPWKKYRSVAGHSSPRDRCYCDESCVITGDCCHDYHFTCQKTTLLIADLSSTCWDFIDGFERNN